MPGLVSITDLVIRIGTLGATAMASASDGRESIHRATIDLGNNVAVESIIPQIYHFDPQGNPGFQ